MKTISTDLTAHIAGEVTTLATGICQLGLMNQNLIARSIDIGLFDEIKCLKHIDQKLLWLLHKASDLDFVAAVIRGRTLLVGEGNLSFSLSLARMSQITPHRLVATTFERRDDLSDTTLENAAVLRAMGVTVLHGVDASKLASTFGSWHFDNIVFQFPHAGTREISEGHNPNYILLRDFLLSANAQLNRDGQVLISAVDSPHYRGAFQFEMAAEVSGFQAPVVYSFDPSKFRGYNHVMTHQSGSALENHESFSTWVFRK